MDIEKTFDNLDDSDKVEDWIREMLEREVEPLMDKYETNFVEVWIVDHTNNRGKYFILN